VDSLRNKINARQIEIQTTEMSLAASEGELADFTSALRESRTQQRLAGERLEQSIGKPEEARLRWLLALATLRNDLNETGAVTRGVQVQLWSGCGRSSPSSNRNSPRPPVTSVSPAKNSTINSRTSTHDTTS
jgi:hypothetical protein